MDRLNAQIQRERTRLGAGDDDVSRIVQVWPAAVGEAIARNAWPARLGRDGTLNVNAVSATWAFELGRMAPDILEQLRAALGSTAPAALRFAPGPVPEPPAQRPARPREIPIEDRAEAATLTAGIEDEELREAVVRAAAASLARARSDLRF